MEEIVAKFTGNFLPRLKGSIWQASAEPEY